MTDELDICHRALVIEDEKDMADLIRNLLEGEGYIVDNAYNGITAKYNLKGENYNIVTVDLKMPYSDAATMITNLSDKLSEDARIFHKSCIVVISTSRQSKTTERGRPEVGKMALYSVQL